ncbi:NADH:flavin oxidoreductase [Desulforegula conservatrix]|uniref:NADH:flavin oxidoreductase n=1 Tax=Desulforegula conservatrix TaxID=153026 RepID=UPI00040AFC77|nr:NADH:flavin oxidoreductase [Desulforegula conservatrix]
MAAKKSLSSATVGGIEVKNRIFRSATHEGFADKNKVSDRLIQMYRDLSAGGVGLIITGYVNVSNTDNPGPHTVTLTDDSCIPGLQKLAETVHQHGSRIVAQLNHATSQIFSVPKGTVYGPSDVADPATGIKPVPFTTEQIRELVKEFGEAALRAKKAGYDGVQIHGAHGYLLSKFLSPLFNTRTDEYGGSPEKNRKVALDVLEEIKNKCGNNFPVWIKLNCSDFDHAGAGLDTEEFIEVARALAEKGIDAIEVSGGTFAGKFTPCRSKKHSAYHLNEAKMLLEAVSVPVILVGGLKNIDSIDQILSETDIEAVSMSRPFIREPDLVKRWMNGDRKDATCISCNGCFNPKGTQCFFNLSEDDKAVQKEIMKFMSFGKKE